MMFGTFSLDAVLILLVCFFWSSLAIHCPIGFGEIDVEGVYMCPTRS